MLPANQTPHRTPVEGGTGVPHPKQFGRFLLEEEIGRRGMGVVYRTRHPESGLVAITMLSRGDQDLAAHRRLRREGRGLSRLDVPNVCPVLELGKCHGKDSIAMEIIEGESFARRSRRAFELSPDLPLAIEVLERPRGWLQLVPNGSGTRPLAGETLRGPGLPRSGEAGLGAPPRCAEGLVRGRGRRAVGCLAARGGHSDRSLSRRG